MFKCKIVYLILVMLVYRDACCALIPSYEQEILENFFETMISSEYFGYVLFGEKPMAAAGYETVFAPEDVLDGTFIRQHRIRLGWETWDKYSKFFLSERFVMRLSKSPLSKDYSWILLVNKETTLNCVKHNLKIFKSVLGNDTTPHSVLQALITKDDVFNEALNRSDVLLGILFGYGKTNSIKFQLRRKTTQTQPPFLYKLPAKPNNLEAFNKQPRELIRIALPRFAADLNSPETKALYQSYSITQALLSHIYRERNYFKLTLDVLASP